MTSLPAESRRGRRPAVVVAEADDAADLRLLGPAVAAWAAAWAAPLVPWRLVVVAAGAALAAVLVLLYRRRRGPGEVEWRADWIRLGLCAAVIAAAAAGLAASARDVAVDRGPLAELAADGAAVRAEAVVVADPRRARPAHASPARGPVFVVGVRIERVTGRGSTTSVRSPAVALADGSWSQLLPGTRIVASGRLAPAADDATSAVLLARGPPTIAVPPGRVQRVAGGLRAGLRDAVAQLPPDERGLVPGLVVGDTSGLSAELAETFRTAGLTHLVAVSGANVAIVCGAVLLVLLRVGMTRRVAAGGALLALVGFAVLARPQPSVLRAGVMGAIGLLALVSGRRRAAVPALAAAVLVLLLIDPGLARSYGFALSVLATGGIVVLARGWTLKLRARGVPAALGAALAVPAAAQLACAPVVAMLAGQVNLVAVPANLLVAPAVAPATLAGVAAAVVAPVSPPVASVLGWCAGVPAAWIVAVAERAAAVPYAAVPWPDGAGGGLALVGIGVAAMLLGRLLVVAVRRIPAVLAAGAAAVLVAALLVARSAPGWPPPGWLLVACDVGQGDALVLSAGDGTAVVVDAGPDPAAVDGCLRRIRVSHVAALVLTHLHADHVDGLAGVLRRRSVGAIHVGPLDDPPHEATAVSRLATEATVAVRRVDPGEAHTAGNLRWQVLWPTRVLRGEGSEPNNASVVLLVDVGGVRLLLTGDVEVAAQRALLPALRRVLAGHPVDVLKVAHHGSASQDAALVGVAAPRVALISVGADNSYGHPARPTLETLAAAGAQVWRTDVSGDVAVLGPAERLRVVGRGG